MPIKRTTTQLPETRPITVARVVIEHADILTLPQAPFELIAAPAANVILMPESIRIYFDWTADYTNINSSMKFKLGIGDVGDGWYAWPAELNDDSFLGGGQRRLFSKDRLCFGELIGNTFSASALDHLTAQAMNVIIADQEFSGTIATLSSAGTAAAGTASYDVAVEDALSNSGSGVGATFHITRAGGVYTVSIEASPDSLKGSGFAENDAIVIKGSDLGGVDTTNDLTITVETVATLTENFEGGNPNNRLIIEVLYREVDLSA